MSQSLIEVAYQLTQAGKAFVLATVVWCERPTSAKIGSQAIIQEDGHLLGWVGGSCTQPVVQREARRILNEGGDPFLLRLGTSGRVDNIQPNPGVLFFPMTCSSGGALDIYMEPHLLQPKLLLIGISPIITALTRLVEVLDMTTTLLNEEDLDQAQIDERTYILIATHGQYDEQVLERVLPSAAAYIGMVSSPRRASACRDYLRTSGMPEAQIDRLKAPAGLDIGAVTPEEIATSILAELVQVQRRTPHRQDGATEHQNTRPQEALALIMPVVQASTAVDPVCGMSVEIAGARQKSEHAGQNFYFCCPACKREFEREPEHFLVTNHPG